jgi:bifunctional non-homologous end joining protein LigD
VPRPTATEPFPRYDPQLALLVEAPPVGDGWFHEIKRDGYRIGAAIRRNGTSKTANLLSRRRLDWTKQFSPIAAAAATLPADDALLDGELVVLLPDGRDDFNALQHAAGRPDPRLVYFAFDLLYLDGKSLLKLPLQARKERLAALLATAPAGPIQYSDHFTGEGLPFFEAARAAGVEGIVSKRASASYRTGSRTADWQKTKCVQRQEFVVGGYLKSDAAPLAALHVGYYDSDQNTFRFAGKVGTGFQTIEATLLRQLEQLSQQTCPFAETARPKGRDFREAFWVTPTIVIEVAFLSWTPDRHLRHPSFKGLRRDKDARAVRRETAAK